MDTQNQGMQQQHQGQVNCDKNTLKMVQRMQRPLSPTPLSPKQHQYMSDYHMQQGLCNNYLRNLLLSTAQQQMRQAQPPQIQYMETPQSNIQQPQWRNSQSPRHAQVCKYDC